ncbi:IclR family transcriptional regulator [Bradyrhizobium sediminis]|uniref:IclR family transcriptional regulator n=1 Tax=Bradyrhizobium sediminis TaxID=2840469 RepID=UPI00201C6712|nr:IclR family transcriptional regulator [Bradyrhizobium sediminis]
MTWAPLSVLPAAIALLSCSLNYPCLRLVCEIAARRAKPISHNTVRQLILWYARTNADEDDQGAVQSFRWPDRVRHRRVEMRSVRPRTKPKANEKPASPRKAAVAKLVKPPQADIDDDADDRQRGGGVQSLGRAFAILEEVARHRDGIGLADLSKLVGLHNSTTFHLAKTMVSLGYIRQEKDSKRYRVGRPLFALAASALDEIEMVNVATPVLEDLSRETGESGHFAVRMGDAVVVIARTSGPGAFQLTDRVGVVRPAHCTALGKIILASLRPEQLKRFLERVDLKPSTEKSITDVPALMREIAEIKHSGIAFDDGEFNPEVRCIAVPVMDFTGQTVGALGISGPIWRLSIQALQNHAKTIRAAANRLSAEFGAKDIAKST